MRFSPLVLLVLFIPLGIMGATVTAAEDDLAVSFQRSKPTLRILIDGQPVAEYVFQDDQILRPYFRRLRTPEGLLVTRNQPPEKDHEDHATMHPGLWLAFGDLNGADFWRNKGQVRHVRFSEEPKVDERGAGSFAVENAYEIEGKILCTETCKITILKRDDGYLLDLSSTFQSEQEFAFGDQEEMGLGIRVSFPLVVKNGGEIVDNENRKNEAEIWGKQADWSQYRGVIDGQRIGVVLMPAPDNFRRSWFHARDYGLLVANPFGQNAFTKGEKSRITVKPGEPFHLRFAVLVYADSADKPLDVAGIYQSHFAE